MKLVVHVASLTRLYMADSCSGSRNGNLRVKEHVGRVIEGRWKSQQLDEWDTGRVSNVWCAPPGVRVLVMTQSDPFGMRRREFSVFGDCAVRDQCFLSLKMRGGMLTLYRLVSPPKSIP